MSLLCARDLNCHGGYSYALLLFSNEIILVGLKCIYSLVPANIRFFSQYTTTVFIIIYLAHLTQSGLVLHQGRVPEKLRSNRNCASWKQNSHL